MKKKKDVFKFNKLLRSTLEHNGLSANDIAHYPDPWKHVDAAIKDKQPLSEDDFMYYFLKCCEAVGAKHES